MGNGPKLRPISGQFRQLWADVCDTEVVMTTRSVAPAAMIDVLVAAGSLVAAPVAKADIDFEGAEDAAVLWCDVLGKTNDCQVVTSGLGCLSIAASSDGKGIHGGSRAISRRC
jgi:hypothetical protein